MIYEITRQDIDNYLATKKNDEVVGVSMNGAACLAHNTLVWKYGLPDDEVTALTTYALVKDTTIDFPQDVENAVVIFDNLKPGAPVTKAEFILAEI